MIKYCGVALCALTAVIVLRGQKSEFAGIAAFAAAVLLFGAAVAEFLPVLSELERMIKGTGFESCLPTMTKALGITLVVQFSAELCRDAGESSIASKLELVGKAEIVLLALPLIGKLLGLAAELMK